MKTTRCKCDGSTAGIELLDLEYLNGCWCSEKMFSCTMLEASRKLALEKDVNPQEAHVRLTPNRAASKTSSPTTHPPSPSLTSAHLFWAPVDLCSIANVTDNNVGQWTSSDRRGTVFKFESVCCNACCLVNFL
jgi:hypothetical protein